MLSPSLEMSTFHLSVGARPRFSLKEMETLKKVQIGAQQAGRAEAVP
jgi:hypothetical protein